MKINGKEIAVSCPVSLQDLLQQLNYRLEVVVVEVNGAIVARERHKEHILHDEDCIEVVSFVGGG